MSRLDELCSMSLEEMRRRFVECGEELPRGGLMLLEADRRAGAREVAARVWRRMHAAQAEGRRVSRLGAFDQPLWDAGLPLVAGLDEGGIAPVGAPVIAAAATLAPRPRIDGGGASPIHRRSFAPVAKARGLIPEQQELFAAPPAQTQCRT